MTLAIANNQQQVAPVVDMSALPLLAVIKKGAPKNGNRPGADLEYFRPEWRTEDDYLQQVFMDLYGNKPDRLLIRFFDNNPFTDVYEIWHGNNTLKARHNGIHYIKRWVGDGYDFTPAPLDAAADECKRVGRLEFWLPEFTAQTWEIGKFVALTTSGNDCDHIASVINFVKQNAMRTGVQLWDVDFELFRYPRSFTVPIKGKPSKTTKYMLGLKINRDSVKAHVLAREDNRRQIASGDDDIIDMALEELDAQIIEPINATQRNNSIVERLETRYGHHSEKIRNRLNKMRTEGEIASTDPESDIIAAYDRRVRIKEQKYTSIEELHCFAADQFGYKPDALPLKLGTGDVAQFVKDNSRDAINELLAA